MVLISQQPLEPLKARILDDARFVLMSSNMMF